MGWERKEQEGRVQNREKIGRPIKGKMYSSQHTRARNLKESCEPGEGKEEQRNKGKEKKPDQASTARAGVLSNDGAKV